MRRRLALFLLFGTVITGSALHFVGKVWATPSSGFSGVTLAAGTFGEIDVFNQLPREGNVWLSLQKTKGKSDVYVQSNVWQPGGSTGWHTHPGHSLIIVTAGAVTAYEGDDPNCTPHVYQAGAGFVDPGGDHVHNIRNETSVAASTTAVQVIPARPDGTSSAPDRRVDAVNPGNCSF